MQHKNETKTKHMPRLLDAVLYEIGDENVKLMKKHGVILAGGCFTSAFCMSPINDIDVYFKNEENFYDFLDELDCNGEWCSDNRYGHLSNKALTVIDTTSNMRIQLIFNGWYPTVEDVFNNFDFTVNMCAFDMSLLDTDEDSFLEMNVDFEKHNLQRQLVFNMNTQHPLCSAQRVNKYKEKGYNITPHEFNKVCLAISLVKVDSWDSFHAQIGGFYGMGDTLDYISEFKEQHVIDYINDNGYLDLPFNGVYRTDFYNKVYEIMWAKRKA